MESLDGKVLDVVEHLLDTGDLNYNEYIGFSKSDNKKPCHFQVGSGYKVEIEFIPNVRSNGEYYGLQGLNILREGC